MMQVPPAELSMMSATPGKNLAGQSGNYNRRNQGSDHDSPLAHSNCLLSTTFRAYWLGHIGLFGPP